MTDEELKQTMQAISESLAKLSDPDQPLSKEEERRKYLLLLKKETLEKIKSAREKNQKTEELRQSMVYGLLESWGEKHPNLMRVVRSKFGLDMFA